MVEPDGPGNIVHNESVRDALFLGYVMVAPKFFAELSKTGMNYLEIVQTILLSFGNAAKSTTDSISWWEDQTNKVKKGTAGQIAGIAFDNMSDPTIDPKENLKRIMDSWKAVWDVVN